MPSEKDNPILKALKRLPAQVAFAIPDAIQAIGELAGIRPSGTKSASDTVNEKIGAPGAPENLTEGLTELLLSLAAPGGAIKSAPVALGILKGTNAIVTHNTTIPDLLKALYKEDKKFTNLSAAITEKAVQENFGSTTLLLRESALDPKSNPMIRIYPQDAYTTTVKDTALHNPSGESGFLQRKIAETLSSDDGKFGQNVNPGAAHGMQILASDVFTDFTKYVESPSGYKRLLRTTDPESDSAIAFQRFVRKFPGVKISDASDIATQRNAVKILKEAAESGDLDAIKILDRFKTGASGYGELKVFGDTPIDSNLIKAVITPTRAGWDRNVENVKDTQRLLDQLEIPLYTYPEAARKVGMDVGDRNFLKPAQELEVLKLLSED